ncbi:hypothetical protein DYGSA30_18540 [Dyella sp. GSA-30]|nr:hypothetical protein DYGSA30_18540 [Dyella sp. GSA-30]
MTKAEFLTLMRFPMEWLSWNLYPDELFEGQFGLYEPGHERGSEHDRNGAFHWWLNRDPDTDTLWKLLSLTKLDPDQLMAQDARRYILRALSRKEKLDASSALNRLESRSGSVDLQVTSICEPGDLVSGVVPYEESGASVFSAPPAIVAEARDAYPYAISITDVGTACFTLVLALISPRKGAEVSVCVDWEALLELE